MLPALGMLPAPQHLLRPGALLCIASAARAWVAAYALSLRGWASGVGNWGLHVHWLAFANRLQWFLACMSQALLSHQCGDSSSCCHAALQLLHSL